MTDDRTLERLVAIARLRDGRLDPAEDEAQREQLVAALAARATRRSRRFWSPRWAVAALVLGVAGATTVVVLQRGEDAALEYAIEGAPTPTDQGTDQGYVQANDEPVTIRFSDGTRFVAEPSSAGRVISVDDSGARLLLERGTFSVAVVHTEGRTWNVAAGPYVVRVTGTRFDLSWSPEREQLSLDLEEGKVSVAGPMLEGELSMQAGQILVVRLTEGDYQVRSASTAATTPPAPKTAPPKNDETLASASASPEPAPLVEPAPPPPVSWSELVARGSYDQVLAEAEARGIEAVLTGGSVGDVVALGDAARYRGRGDIARKALASLWERFSDQRAGKSAAFLLGRLSEGSPASAIAWYDRYLASDPGGPYAAEAFGRKLELVARGNPTAAKALARQYLAAYPKGAYAAFAQSLLK